LIVVKNMFTPAVVEQESVAGLLTSGSFFGIGSEGEQSIVALGGRRLGRESQDDDE
jgi:hypothetical protein